MNRKACLESEMRKAIEEKKSFAISVTVPTCTKPEIIVNPWENLEFKLEYYKKAYNDNLELVHNNDIKIIDFGPLYHSIDKK